MDLGLECSEVLGAGLGERPLRYYRFWARCIRIRICWPLDRIAALEVGQSIQIE